jgi:hypothetical protein
MARHWQALAESIDRLQATTLDDVLRRVHPQIAGGCASCTTAGSSPACQRLDHLLWHTIDRWATRKHSRKRADGVVQPSCQPDGTSQHGSVVGATQTLRWPSNTPGKRPVPRRTGVRPYEGHWSSWGTRRGKDSGLATPRGKLRKPQGGRCTPGCLFCTVEAKLAIHQADGHPRHRQLTTLRRLHLIGHDLTHGTGHSSTMPMSTARRAQDQSDITEEPCASKEASTVVETSREG